MALIRDHGACGLWHARWRRQCARGVIPSCHGWAAAVKHAVAAARPGFGEELDCSKPAECARATPVEARVRRALAFPQWLDMP